MEKYEKIKVIGQGAFGKVYLVRSKVDNSLVVIKQIPIQEMAREERQAALNEVDILKKLQHPNIIAYHESFLAESSLMIVMEYAPGGTLFEYIQQRNGRLMDEEHILQIFAQILISLQHIHALNIMHRDLKTQNIMLTRKRNVIKVGDFGISKVLSSKMTSAKTIVGTPCYISPEICEGKHYNTKSDIWASGCLLYELATLKKAFEALTLPALVMKIMQGNFDPIDRRYSQSLSTLINKMLSIKPNARPDVEQIMAEPLLANVIVNLYTDIGRLPFSRSRQSSMGNSGGKRRSIKTPQGRQRSFFEDYWAEDEETLLQGPVPIAHIWGSGIAFPMVLPPVANAKITSVAVGRTRRLGLTEDGKVVSWDPSSGVFGTTTFSTLGTMRKTRSSEPPTFGVLTIDALSSWVVKKVCCGDVFTACLTERHIVMTMGSGSNGCLGHGDYEDHVQPKMVETLLGYDTLDIACGAHHMAALMSEGPLFIWGKGDSGQLGLQTTAMHNKPQSVARLPEGFKITSLFCGPDSTAVLSDTGQLLVCGSNRCGKLGIRKTVTVSSDELSRESRSPLAIGSPPPPPQVDKSPSPLPITAKPKSVAQLLSSRRMSSAIVSSLLSSSPQLELPGDKRQDQITVSSSESVLIFTEVVSLPLETADKVTTLALGPTHSVFATSRGRCITCGSNTFGQLGYSAEGGGEPRKVDTIEHENVKLVACGDAFTVVTTADGLVYNWGKSQRGRLGREVEGDGRSFEPQEIIFEGSQKVQSLSSCHGVTLLLTRRTS